MSDQSNLPVLTLDFDEEQITRLEDIAEKFRTLSFSAPSGEQWIPTGTEVLPPGAGGLPVPGITPESDTGKVPGAVDKMLDKLNTTSRKTLRTWRAVNRELNVTTQALGTLFRSSVRWGAALAGIAAAGPLGYGALSNRVSESVMQAQANNVSPGTMQAITSTYGRVFSNVEGAISQLAAAQNDVTNPLYGGQLSAGIDPTRSPDENYGAILRVIARTLDQYGDSGAAIPVLNAMNLGSIATPELVNQVAANRDRLPELEEQFRTRQRQNDASLPLSAATGYQVVSSGLANNADQITNSLLNALSRLQGPIVDLSDELTGLITNFIDGPNGDAVFDTIADGLRGLSQWLGSDEFQKDMKEFGQDLSAVVKGLRELLKWLADFLGKDPAEIAGYTAAGAVALGALGAGGVGGAVRAGGKIAGQAIRATGGLLRLSPLTALPLALLPNNDTPTTDEEFERIGVQRWWENQKFELDADGSITSPTQRTYKAGRANWDTPTENRPPLQGSVMDMIDQETNLLRENPFAPHPAPGTTLYDMQGNAFTVGGYYGGQQNEPNAPTSTGNTGVSRGIRNNNPGNLRYAGQRGAWSDADGFAVFKRQSEGIAQIDHQLALYAKRGKDTIREIISTYAPPNENKTDKYISFVANRTGIDPDAQLNHRDPVETSQIIRAIIDYENGEEARRVTSGQIAKVVEERRRLPVVPLPEPVELEIVPTPGSDFRAQTRGQTGGN